ncbi:MAG: aspartate/glutamate racemase family protein [Pseudomonas sp.]|uniref:aspartate/glutamate racemase family protein n=1 Tax=Pseudomonas sp. TaxID=306 RepID=UPI002732B709|nr:aspartate/glutamate racemase family protein [Pseudomonas sp.]MDP3847269.1 aspartate/glutamate racemase family protein [Pseudomonas sp.]
MSALRICILAPVNTDAYNQQLLAAVQPVIPADVLVEVRNIRQGNPCIENRLNLTENALPVVQMAQSIEREGFQGIWLSDFDMCGVEAAREVIDIPIIGGFPTSAFSALSLCQRFSIITIMPSTLAMQRGHVANYGLSESFASIYSINCPVDQLSNLDIVVAKTFEMALQAIKQDGAQSILLGCTGFVDVAARVGELLEEALGSYVPVLDPNQCGFSFLLSLVRMKLRPSRLCYSKATLPAA